MQVVFFMIVAFLAVPECFAQEKEETPDEQMTTKIVGYWEHESSTFPSGNVSKYRRGFQFCADGSGICSHFVEGDTIFSDFTWEIKDSTVLLYIKNPQGSKVNCDAQYITLVNETELYLDKLYGTEELRKVTYYRRKELQTDVAKY